MRESTQVLAARQLTLRGLEQLHEGDLEGAESSFRQAVEASPQDERARSEYAQLLWKRGATTEAVRHMTECVRLSGGGTKPQVELGEMLLALGDLNGAANCAQRAVQAEPNHARAQVLSGDVARRMGRYDLALEHYHWALDVDDFLPAAQIAAAEIYKKKGKPRRALSTLQPLNPEKLPLEQAQKVALLRGIALKELNRPRDAIHSLTAPVLQENPDAELLHHLAEAYWMAGEPNSAAHAARQALSLDSTRANTQSLLARIQSGTPRVALTARDEGTEGM